MSRYAQRTEVPVERTQAEIKKTLRKYGADDIVTGDSARLQRAFVQYRFRGLPIEAHLRLPNPNEERFQMMPSGRAPTATRAADMVVSISARGRETRPLCDKCFLWVTRHTAELLERMCSADRACHGDAQASRDAKPKAQGVHMKNISFAWTTDALLKGRKTVTRRFWDDRYARQFHAGDQVAAYNKSPRSGGRQVATIRITREPYKQSLYDVTDRDEQLEGGLWGSGYEYREAMIEQGRGEMVWVIEFELVKTPAAKQPSLF